MGTRVAGLFVELNADASGLGRNLDASSLKVSAWERSTSRAAASAETSLSGAFGRISTASAAAATKLASFTAGLSVAALVGFASQAAAIARSVAEIGDKAKLAGLSAKDFQQLGFVARQNRISVDTLADGMKELQLRADEWVKTGSGSGAESFQRLGFSAEDLRRKLQKPSDLFVEIVERMQRLNGAARIRVSDELFGGQAGERFVQLVDQGAEAIRGQIKEANELGLILDDKIIRRAAEIDAKFQKITETVGTGLKGAVVNVAAGLDTWLDSFREIDKQTNDNVLRALQSVYAKKAAAEDALSGMVATASTGFGGAAYAGEIERQRAEVERLANEAMRLRDILDSRAGWPGADAAGKAAADATPSVQGLVDTLAQSVPTTAAATEAMKAYASALQTLQQAVPGLADSLDDLNKRDTINRAYADALKNARSIGDQQRAEAARNAALAALDVPNATGGVVPPVPVADPRRGLDATGFEQVTEQAKQTIAQLQMERQALGLTTVEADALRRSFELLNEVQKANGEVTPQQRQEIIALASQQARLADENDRLKASTEDFAKSAQQEFESVASSIGAALARTKDWKSVLGEVIQLLVNLAAKWAGPKIATALGVAPTAPTTSSVAAAVSKTLGGSASAAANDNVSTALASNVVDLAAYRQAIGSIESSGNYGALGVLTKSGDRAYGKYQVMGSNIAPWTKDALGYSMTPDQFLSAPWAQDMVFNKQFGNSLAKYGNANDAASVWFTGRPLSQGAGATDILGTSGSQYVANFNAALEKTTGSLGNMNSTVTDAIGLLGKPANNATWLSGGATGAVAKSASGPLDLGQFTGGAGGGGGFVTSITGLFTNIFSGIGKALSGLVGGAAKGIGGFFSSILGGLFSANGNAFGPGGLTAFASGGIFTNSIVATPTVFKFANGGKFGVMGEAGEEAVVPLSRDSSGRLGVSLHGAMNDNWAAAMGGMAKVAAGSKMSGGGGVMHYRAGDTIIQGNVTEDIWPRVRAEIAMSAAETKKDIGRNFGSYQRISTERD